MNFDEMCSIARVTFAQKTSSGIKFTFNDTICVVSTADGNKITGTSQMKYINNSPVIIHAEMDIYNILCNNNATIVEIALFNAVNFQPVIPCNECVAKLISLNKENAKALLILPDRSVPISELNAFLQSQNNIADPFKNVSPVKNNDNYQYLQGRLNELFVDDEEEEETEPTEKSKPKKEKKGFFNFFKGKSEK